MGAAYIRGFVIFFKEFGNCTSGYFYNRFKDRQQERTAGLLRSYLNGRCVIMPYPIQFYNI